MQWLVRGASPNDALFFHCKRVSLRYIYPFSLSLLLDSGHGGQTKDLIGDKADGFEDGYSILFKRSIIANTNDIYSYLSRKFVGYAILMFLLHMLLITGGFPGKWPHCRRCKCCLHLYSASLIPSLRLCIEQWLHLSRQVVV